MRADDTEEGFDVQVTQRKEALRKGPIILKRIADLKVPTPTNFLAIYEELLFGVWHASALHRGKRIIAMEPVVFRDALRALAASRSDDPETLYDLLLGYTDQVPRAGVNVITEILHSRNAGHFLVMNADSVSGLQLANIVGYPDPLTKTSVDGECYARFCGDADKVREGLGLANFSELDAVFNYAYWRGD